MIKSYRIQINNRFNNHVMIHVGKVIYIYVIELTYNWLDVDYPTTVAKKNINLFKMLQDLNL